ncbi:conserved hypothetical protein [Stenotrophomonas thermophila]|nr:conserved hypothetical protein [Stenotrophomonas maltophilia]
MRRPARPRPGACAGRCRPGPATARRRWHGNAAAAGPPGPDRKMPGTHVVAQRFSLSLACGRQWVEPITSTSRLSPARRVRASDCSHGWEGFGSACSPAPAQCNGQSQSQSGIPWDGGAVWMGRTRREPIHEVTPGSWTPDPTPRDT